VAEGVEGEGCAIQCFGASCGVCSGVGRRGSRQLRTAHL